MTNTEELIITEDVVKALSMPDQMRIGAMILETAGAYVSGATSEIIGGDANLARMITETKWSARTLLDQAEQMEKRDMKRRNRIEELEALIQTVETNGPLVWSRRIAEKLVDAGYRKPEPVNGVAET